MRSFRKRFNRCFSVRSVLCFVAVIGTTLILAIPALDSAPAPQGRGMHRSEPSKVKADEYPPDFELPFLRFGEDADGKPVGIVSDSKTFKLSDFRGKKPVCMIMSSYT